MLCRRRGAGTTDRPQRTRHHPGAEGDGGRPDRVRARGLGRNRRTRLCAEVREQPRQEGRSLLAGEGRRAPEPPSDRWSRRRPRRATRRPISLPTTGTCSASSPDREATPLEVRSTTWPRARWSADSRSSRTLQPTESPRDDIPHHQKDLGSITPQLATKMSRFDPGPGWHKVPW